MNHTFAQWFKQLGLASDQTGMESFLRAHQPLQAATRLEDAVFWTPSQSFFITEQTV